MIRAIVLNEGDNVATLIDAGTKGASVTLTGERKDSVILADDIAYGHKLAIRAVASGDPIVKYGKVIGRATQLIGQGQHVHVHNVEALRARGDVKVSA
jgi:altronate dehydratase small subunit